MIRNLLLIAIYLIGVIYLLQTPKPLPTLTDSGLSDEPGDTWQHPDQRGYYTNLSRSQVLSQVQGQTTLSILGSNIPSFRLNYRPEEAGTLVRDQLKSNYLEEVVYPLHSSYFVNGWEPKLAPINPNKKDLADSDLFLKGVPYNAKITLLPISSSPISRLFIWTLIFPASFLVLKSLQFSFKSE